MNGGDKGSGSEQAEKTSFPTPGDMDKICSVKTPKLPPRKLLGGVDEELLPTRQLNVGGTGGVKPLKMPPARA